MGPPSVMCCSTVVCVGVLGCLPFGSESTAAAQRPTMRFRVVSPYGDRLPKGLKIRKRVLQYGSSSDIEQVTVDPRGIFHAPTHYGRTVQLFITSDETAPFETPPLRLDHRITRELHLSKGFPAHLQLRSTDGFPRAGSLRAVLLNDFDANLGTFPIDENGRVTIPHCPLSRIRISIRAAGFEEYEGTLRLTPAGVRTIDLLSTRPARFRLISAVSGKPIKGARVRLLSRQRADSPLKPLTFDEDGPIWARSDKSGRVKLTMLRKIDPRPTNDPGPANYAFAVTAPGHALLIPGVRAGVDLGELRMRAPLEVSGHFDTGGRYARVVAQWRQPAERAEGGPALGTSVEFGGQGQGLIPFRLTGLRPGRLHLFFIVSNSSRPSVRNSHFKQTELELRIKDSVSGLRIHRQGMECDDADAQKVTLQRPAANVDSATLARLAEQSIVTWMEQASMRRLMAYRRFQVFILKEGILVSPDQGIRHRLSQKEFRQLMSQVDKEAKAVQLFKARKRANTGPPVTASAGWNSGSSHVIVRRHGKTLKMVSNQTQINPMGAAIGRLKTHLTRLRDLASMGDEASRARYLSLANDAFTRAADSPPFALVDGSGTTSPDGTRTIIFRRNRDTLVQIVHPLHSQPYITLMRHQGNQLPIRSRLTDR